VPAKTGEGAVAHDLPASARHPASPHPGGSLPHPPNTHADLVHAVANGHDTYWLTRRALTEAGPEGSRALQTLDKYGTKVNYKHGGGSYYEHSANTLHVDLNNPASTAELVHEATHAEYAHLGHHADPAKMGKTDYVNSSLNEEAEASVRQIYANIHLQTNNPHLNLPHAALQSEFTAGYHAAAHQADLAAQAQGRVLAPNERAIAGAAGGRHAVYSEYHSGRVTTSTTGAPYPQYYADGWNSYQNWLKQYGHTPGTP
jgi:hypothetical protein